MYRCCLFDGLLSTEEWEYNVTQNPWGILSYQPWIKPVGETRVSRKYYTYQVSEADDSGCCKIFLCDWRFTKGRKERLRSDAYLTVTDGSRSLSPSSLIRAFQGFLQQTSTTQVRICSLKNVTWLSIKISREIWTWRLSFKVYSQSFKF